MPPGPKKSHQPEPQQTDDLTLQLSAETARTKAEMEKSGFVVPAQPSPSPPMLPSDVADLNGDELVRLHTEIVRWTDYIAGQLALQEVDERYAASTHDYAFSTQLSTIMRGKPKSEGSVTLCKAEANLQPQVAAARERMDMVYGRRKILGMMFTNLERDAFLLSRELTRRTARTPGEWVAGGRGA